MPFKGHVYGLWHVRRLKKNKKKTGWSDSDHRPAGCDDVQLKTLPEVIFPATGEFLANPKGAIKKKYGADFKQWQAEDAEFGQFRRTGVYHFRVH
jgi:hypothetical protein